MDKYVWSASLLLAGLAAGCGDRTVPVHETPIFNPTHSEHIQPIWDANCTFSGCHTDSREAGELSLEGNALNALLITSDDKAMARIEPGEPMLSYVWLKLNDLHRDFADGRGAAMPLHASPLFDPDLATIENWIILGAAP